MKYAFKQHAARHLLGHPGNFNDVSDYLVMNSGYLRVLVFLEEEWGLGQWGTPPINSSFGSDHDPLIFYKLPNKGNRYHLSGSTHVITSVPPGQFTLPQTYNPTLTYDLISYEASLIPEGPNPMKRMKFISFFDMLCKGTLPMNPVPEGKLVDLHGLLYALYHYHFAWGHVTETLAYGTTLRRNPFFIVIDPRIADFVRPQIIHSENRSALQYTFDLAACRLLLNSKVRFITRWWRRWMHTPAMEYRRITRLIADLEEMDLKDILSTGSVPDTIA